MRVVFMGCLLAGFGMTYQEEDRGEEGALPLLNSRTALPVE